MYLNAFLFSSEVLASDPGSPWDTGASGGVANASAGASQDAELDLELMGFLGGDQADTVQIYGDGGVAAPRVQAAAQPEADEIAEAEAPAPSLSESQAAEALFVPPAPNPVLAARLGTPPPPAAEAGAGTPPEAAEATLPPPEVPMLDTIPAPSPEPSGTQTAQTLSVPSSPELVSSRPGGTTPSRAQAPAIPGVRARAAEVDDPLASPIRSAHRSTTAAFNEAAAGGEKTAGEESVTGASMSQVVSFDQFLKNIHTQEAGLLSEYEQFCRGMVESYGYGGVSINGEKEHTAGLKSQLASAQSLITKVEDSLSPDSTFTSTEKVQLEFAALKLGFIGEGILGNGQKAEEKISSTIVKSINETSQDAIKAEAKIELEIKHTSAHLDKLNGFIERAKSSLNEANKKLEAAQKSQGLLPYLLSYYYYITGPSPETQNITTAQEVIRRTEQGIASLRSKVELKQAALRELEGKKEESQENMPAAVARAQAAAVGREAAAGASQSKISRSTVPKLSITSPDGEVVAQGTYSQAVPETAAPATTLESAADAQAGAGTPPEATPGDGGASGAQANPEPAPGVLTTDSSVTLTSSGPLNLLKLVDQGLLSDTSPSLSPSLSLSPSPSLSRGFDSDSASLVLELDEDAELSSAAMDSGDLISDSVVTLTSREPLSLVDQDLLSDTSLSPSPSLSPSQGFDSDSTSLVLELEQEGPESSNAIMDSGDLISDSVVTLTSREPLSLVDQDLLSDTSLSPSPSLSPATKAAPPPASAAAAATGSSGEAGEVTAGSGGTYDVGGKFDELLRSTAATADRLKEAYGKCEESRHTHFASNLLSSTETPVSKKNLEELAKEMGNMNGKIDEITELLSDEKAGLTDVQKLALDLASTRYEVSLDYVAEYMGYYIKEGRLASKAGLSLINQENYPYQEHSNQGVYEPPELKLEDALSEEKETALKAVSKAGWTEFEVERVKAKEKAYSQAQGVDHDVTQALQAEVALAAELRDDASLSSRIASVMATREIIGPIIAVSSEHVSPAKAPPPQAAPTQDDLQAGAGAQAGAGTPPEAPSPSPSPSRGFDSDSASLVLELDEDAESPSADQEKAQLDWPIRAGNGPVPSLSPAAPVEPETLTEAAKKQKKEHEEALISDVMKGKYQAAIGKLDAGVDPNIRHSMTMTLLHYVAIKGGTEGKKMVEALLNKGADVNARTYSGMTPLHYAVINGHTSVVVALLSKEGIDLNCVDNLHERTPLHHAVINGHTDVVKALIDTEAKVNIRDKQKFTPLHHAIIKGHTDMAKALINAGANVNAKDKQNLTPLHHAIINGHTDVVKALIDAEAKVNIRDKQKFTPLHHAIINGHTDVVKALIDAGANVNAKDKQNLTPLHHAIINGHTDVVKALIDAEAKVNIRDKQKFTPLHHAIINGHMDMAKALIEAGAKVNITVKGYNGADDKPLLDLINDTGLKDELAALAAKVAAAKAAAAGNTTSPAAGAGAPTLGTIPLPQVQALDGAAGGVGRKLGEFIRSTAATAGSGPSVPQTQPQHQAAGADQSSLTEAESDATSRTQGRSSGGLIDRTTVLAAEAPASAAAAATTGAGAGAVSDSSASQDAAEVEPQVAEASESEATLPPPAASSSLPSPESEASGVVANASAGASQDAELDLELMNGFFGGDQADMVQVYGYGGVAAPRVQAAAQPEAPAPPQATKAAPPPASAAAATTTGAGGGAVSDSSASQDAAPSTEAESDATSRTQGRSSVGLMDRTTVLAAEAPASAAAATTTTGAGGGAVSDSSASQGAAEVVRARAGEVGKEAAKAARVRAERLQDAAEVQKDMDDLLEYGQYLAHEAAKAPVLAKREDDLALLAAAKDRKAGEVIAKLAAGVNPNIHDAHWMTPLHYACENGDKEIAVILLKEGSINVNIGDRVLSPKGKGQSWTPLHYACSNGHGEIVDLLLERKDIDINAKEINFGGLVPLHYAILNGHVGIVKKLIARGADLNVVGLYGRSLLHYVAIRGGPEGKEMLEELIRARANINARDINGFTPLELAVEYGHTDVVKALLNEKGIDLNLEANRRYSLLHLAARYGHTDTLKELLEKDYIDVNTKGSIGSINRGALVMEDATPLEVASRYGHIGVLSALLERDDIDVNTKNDALRLASMYGHLDVVKKLLDKGADVNSLDENRESALYHASERGHIDVAKELVARGAEIEAENASMHYSPLCIAVINNHIDLVYALLKLRADVNLTDRHCRTPIEHAIEAGNEDMVTELIMAGAKLNTITTFTAGALGKRNLPLLHIAIRSGNMNMVEELIKAGAGVNTLDEEKRPPLHFAIMMRRNTQEDKDKRKAVIEALVKAGAKLDLVREKEAKQIMDQTSSPYKYELKELASKVEKEVKSLFSAVILIEAI